MFSKMSVSLCAKGVPDDTRKITGFEGMLAQHVVSSTSTCRLFWVNTWHSISPNINRRRAVYFSAKFGWQHEDAAI